MCRSAGHRLRLRGGEAGAVVHRHRQGPILPVQCPPPPRPGRCQGASALDPYRLHSTPTKLSSAPCWSSGSTGGWSLCRTRGAGGEDSSFRTGCGRSPGRCRCRRRRGCVRRAVESRCGGRRSREGPEVGDGPGRERPCGRGHPETCPEPSGVIGSTGEVPERASASRAGSGWSPGRAVTAAGRAAGSAGCAGQPPGVAGVACSAQMTLPSLV